MTAARPGWRTRIEIQHSFFFLIHRPMDVAKDGDLGITAEPAFIIAYMQMVGIPVSEIVDHKDPVTADDAGKRPRQFITPFQRIAVAADGCDRRDLSELIQDVPADDIAGMEDAVHSAQLPQHGLVQHVMSVGQHADGH